jgi:flagellar biosynthetic protein FliR
VTIRFDPLLVTAFFLALVRATAWLFISPPFNTRLIPTGVKTGLAAALALAAAPHLAHSNLTLSTAPFYGELLTQVVVGVTLGLLTLILVNAISTAGSLVDIFAGYSLASVYDPLSEHTAAVFGRFYELIAATLLFATNGHLILVNGFYRSFDAVPANGLPAKDIAKVLTDNMGVFFIAAIEVAGPILGCLFLTELLMGLLARAAPSLNVFSLAFPVRVVVALLLVAIALPLITPALDNLVHTAVAPFGG